MEILTKCPLKRSCSLCTPERSGGMKLPFAPRYCEVSEPLEHVMAVHFNRPKAMNSMPPAMHAELSKIFRYFDAEDSLWVAILTGNGRAFSAGFDLKSAAGTAPQQDMQPDLTTGLELSGEVDTQMIPGGTGFGGVTERDGVKPIIAAVNGVAHGGGMEVALACDVIVASEKANFALPEPRVGLWAAAGGVIRLTRTIGYHRAMSLILTGRSIGAQEAKELGIVTAVVPGGNDEVFQAALKLAQQILRCSPDSVQASVEVAKRSATEPSLNAAIKAQISYPTVERLRASENWVEGPKAFGQKRKPVWVPPRPMAEFLKSNL